MLISVVETQASFVFPRARIGIDALFGQLAKYFSFPRARIGIDEQNISGSTMVESPPR
jgi:hypothetical protein